MNGHALDALLAEYAAPPVPAGLAARVAAAALALPQEPRLPLRARPRHDRRKAWLRRPLLIGSIALGLAVSGAVAATLAGIRLDRLPIVAAILAELPFLDRGTPPESVPPPRMAPPAVAPPPAGERPVVEQREAGIPAEPRAAATRDSAPPVVAPIEAPRPPDVVAPRPIDIPPPPPLPPTSVPRAEASAVIPAPEPRAPERNAAEETRLQQERIERTERLRAARQAQIERLQRIQERRERIRRLRRD